MRKKTSENVIEVPTDTLVGAFSEKDHENDTLPECASSNLLGYCQDRPEELSSNVNNTIIEGNKKTECGKTSPDHKKNKTPPKKIFKQPYVFEEEENKVETKSSTLDEENMDGENSRMEEDEYNRRVRERWKESVRRWEEMDR